MRVLAISPHTDDAEFGAGATIARLVSDGASVHVLALTHCGDATLADEMDAACAILGVASTTILDYEVRRLGDRRQDILDALIRWRDNLDPQLVLCPAASDTHQDHAAVAAEVGRAFKATTVLGYLHPWNCSHVSITHWRRVYEADVRRKLDAIACYRSQSTRPYATEEVVRASLTTAGLQVGCRYAEPFEVLRWVA